MSHLINIAALQETAMWPELPVAKDGLEAPNLEPLKKHFLDVFSRYDRAKAFVVKSKRGNYRLRMDRSGLRYQETSEGFSKEVHYLFDEDRVLVNSREQDYVFLRKFMSRLRQISEDVSCNKATIYEEGLS